MRNPPRMLVTACTGWWKTTMSLRPHGAAAEHITGVDARPERKPQPLVLAQRRRRRGRAEQRPERKRIAVLEPQQVARSRGDQGRVEPAALHGEAVDSRAPAPRAWAKSLPATTTFESARSASALTGVRASSSARSHSAGDWTALRRVQRTAREVERQVAGQRQALGEPDATFEHAGRRIEALLDLGRVAAREDGAQARRMPRRAPEPQPANPCVRVVRVALRSARGAAREAQGCHAGCANESALDFARALGTVARDD